MIVTLLGQQYNIGEKPTVVILLYTYTSIAMQGHQKTLNKQKQCSTYNKQKQTQQLCSAVYN